MRSVFTLLENLLPKGTSWSFSPGNLSLKLYLFFFVVYGVEGGVGRRKRNYSYLLPKIWRNFSNTRKASDNLKKVFFSFFFLSVFHFLFFLFLSFLNFLEVFYKDKYVLWIWIHKTEFQLSSFPDLSLL